MSGHSARWWCRSCYRPLAQSWYTTLNSRVKWEKFSVLLQDRTTLPRAERFKLAFSAHMRSWCFYTPWWSHRRLGCFYGKHGNPFKLCADEETLLIFNGLWQQDWDSGHHQWPWCLQPGGQLWIPGRMLKLRPSQWEGGGSHYVGRLSNALVEWVPYQIPLWKAQVHISLSCTLLLQHFINPYTCVYGVLALTVCVSDLYR